MLAGGFAGGQFVVKRGQRFSLFSLANVDPLRNSEVLNGRGFVFAVDETKSAVGGAQIDADNVPRKLRFIVGYFVAGVWWESQGWLIEWI